MMKLDNYNYKRIKFKLKKAIMNFDSHFYINSTIYLLKKCQYYFLSIFNSVISETISLKFQPLSF